MTTTDPLLHFPSESEPPAFERHENSRRADELRSASSPAVAALIDELRADIRRIDLALNESLSVMPQFRTAVTAFEGRLDSVRAVTDNLRAQLEGATAQQESLEHALTGATRLAATVPDLENRLAALEQTSAFSVEAESRLTQLEQVGTAFEGRLDSVRAVADNLRAQREGAIVNQERIEQALTGATRLAATVPHLEKRLVALEQTYESSVETESRLAQLGTAFEGRLDSVRAVADNLRAQLEGAIINQRRIEQALTGATRMAATVPDLEKRLAALEQTYELSREAESRLTQLEQLALETMNQVRERDQRTADLVRELARLEHRVEALSTSALPAVRTRVDDAVKSVGVRSSGSSPAAADDQRSTIRSDDQPKPRQSTPAWRWWSLSLNVRPIAALVLNVRPIAALVTISVLVAGSWLALRSSGEIFERGEEVAAAEPPPFAADLSANTVPASTAQMQLSLPEARSIQTGTAPPASVERNPAPIRRRPPAQVRGVSREAQNVQAANVPTSSVAGRPSSAVARPTTPPTRRPLFVGTLAVRSVPDGAAVFVDGASAGTTPLRLTGLRAGSHAIRVEHNGYRRWTAAVNVPANAVTQVTASLQGDQGH